MKEFIKLIADMMNEFHDMFIFFVTVLGVEMTDKQMHFWIIGIFGLIFFFLTHLLFQKIAKFNIAILSFIYTFTVLIVLVFAIEIQQKITNRGNMEFEDVVQGLWGFLVLFTIYVFIHLLYMGIKKFLNFNKKKSNNKDHTRMSRYHSM